MRPPATHSAAEAHVTTCGQSVAFAAGANPRESLHVPSWYSYTGPPVGRVHKPAAGA